SYYFDWSVWEIFVTLTSGATLYMIPDEQQVEPEACAGFISKNKITVLHITPTQWQYLLSSGNKESGDKERLDSLRYLFIGAEKLNLDLVERSIAVAPGECRIYNMYGPTEATIISAVLEIDKSALSKYNRLTSVPIGTPVGNTGLLVLDRYLNPVPEYVEGELFIGGDGVAQGYLNNPELTGQRFIKAGRQYAVGSRQEEKKQETKEEKESANSTPHLFYRTGDRARWLPDGTIEYLGRYDFQVKIRGVRIELGEIEKALLLYSDIEEAVVIDRTAGDPGDNGPGQ
ncbi:MAG: amino acid adenylation domain-containing protein, partial [bacterium]|nr:amino acid adenylation domain-containing protein [bacterium]